MMYILQFDSSGVNEVAELVVELLLGFPVEFIFLEDSDSSQFVEANGTSLVETDEHFPSRTRLQESHRVEFGVTELYQLR